jgi:tetratricopeptide (TPR) repeat protein
MNNELFSRTEHLAQWCERIRCAVQSVRNGVEFLAAAAAQPSTGAYSLSLQGWRWLRYGNHRKAQECFRAALHYDPYAAGAWFGLSYTVDTREERLDCLQAALDLEYLNIREMLYQKEDRNLAKYILN